MSYTIFLLLNVNHEKNGLLDFIGKGLERSGQSFCYDRSPDSFFTVEYLQEGKDTSLAIDIPYGGEEHVLKDVLDFLTNLQSYIQFQVLDPQIGRIMESEETPQILEKFKKSNLEALQQFGDGHHFLRTVVMRDGKKAMAEAIKLTEESWQNHCSVALAYNRFHDAENALKHFARAYEMDTENKDILHAIGVTQYNLKQYATASDTLKEVLQSNPQNQDAREILQACEEKLKTQQ